MSHPFIQQEPETYIVSHSMEEERRKLARRFPEDLSIIIESNRKKAEIFIKQQAGSGLDFDGLEHVYKTEFDPKFILIRESDLTFFLKNLYERWDEKYNS